MIHLVTGGERSGKSSYAEQLALDLAEQPIYIATSRIWDENHRARIEKHQNDRDDRWVNMEEEKALSTLPIDGNVVVIDCVTLWLTNFFVDSQQDVQSSLSLAKKEIDLLQKMDAQIFIVTNEIGMGVHASTEVGRKFVQLQGWMNQYIAKKADHVTLMVSGIPMKVK